MGLVADTAGLDALIARLEGLEGLVARYADLIVARAREIAPVDTGALRGSVVAHLDGAAAEIVADAGHAVYVEYGTARAPAQPFLRPAMHAYEAAFLREVAALLGG